MQLTLELSVPSASNPTFIMSLDSLEGVTSFLRISVIERNILSLGDNSLLSAFDKGGRRTMIDGRHTYTLPLEGGLPI